MKNIENKCTECINGEWIFDIDKATKKFTMSPCLLCREEDYKVWKEEAIKLGLLPRKKVQ